MSREESLHVLHRRAVGQSPELHRCLVVLLLLHPGRLELCRHQACGNKATGHLIQLSHRLRRQWGLVRPAVAHPKDQGDAFLARLARDKEEPVVLLEPAPQAALLLDSMPQGPRQQGAEVRQEQRVLGARAQQLHQLRQQHRLVQYLLALRRQLAWRVSCRDGRTCGTRRTFGDSATRCRYRWRLQKILKCLNRVGWSPFGRNR
mmetsp:Transcript_90758/g.163846  ORF Transcript_90758/g.163846 Transcript_90758/m.163846 type:complete len:204 (-) Transcript_90758:412-1023(-)